MSLLSFVLYVFVACLVVIGLSMAGLALFYISGMFFIYKVVGGEGGLLRFLRGK